MPRRPRSALANRTRWPADSKRFTVSPSSGFVALAIAPLGASGGCWPPSRKPVSANETARANAIARRRRNRCTIVGGATLVTAFERALVSEVLELSMRGPNPVLGVGRSQGKLSSRGRPALSRTELHRTHTHGVTL